MKSLLTALVAALVAAGCGSGSGDPCEDVPPPRFLVDDEPVSERIRFPAPGSIKIVVLGQTNRNLDDYAPRVTGTLENTVRLGPMYDTLLASNWVEFDTQQSGSSVIEARDACGRKARLDVEATPVSSVRAQAEVDAWIAALPEELTGGGVALLPDMPFKVHFELLDENGVPLAGTWASGPKVAVSGGLRVGTIAERSLDVVVAGPEGQAMLLIEKGGILEFEVASGNDGIRLEVWRNASVSSHWVDGWAQGTAIGDELVVHVGEIVLLGLHAFDERGRLLIGVDMDREPLELDLGGDALLESRRTIYNGDSWLKGLRAGETNALASKASATTRFRIRVEEESLP